MRIGKLRLAALVGTGIGGAALFAFPGTGCVAFMAESVLTTTDFCFIFDCQNGLFGGTVDPCVGTAPGDTSGQMPIFVDCP